MKTCRPWLLLALGVVAIDVVLKYVMLHFLPSTPWTPGKFVTLGLHKNPGILFDLPVPQPLLWIVTVMLLVVLGRIAVREQTRNPRSALGALITITGALGNFIDRLANGFTTDYLLFFTGSAINLSDLVILVGIFILITAQHRPSKAVSSTEATLTKSEKRV